MLIAYFEDFNVLVLKCSCSVFKLFIFHIDPPPGELIQTCHNCGIGPDCQNHFTIDGLDNIYFDYKCEDACLNSSDCYALQFSTHYASCLAYQCGQVKQSIGQTVYRRTNNTGLYSLGLNFYQMTKFWPCPS